MDRCEPAIIVLAKAPAAGKVKTRCSPPCSPEQAAEFAKSARTDTLRTVCECSAERIVIALVGEVGSWLPSGFEVHVPCAGPLGDRLDHTFRSVGQVAFLIGMGTPQITAPLLELALASMRANRLDVLVGPSDDGGFWSLGLRDPLVDVCHDVPMSCDDTYSLLRVGLRRRRLTCGVLPTLVDVDDFATARDVATDIPGSGFATMIATISTALRLDSIGARP